MGIAYWRSVHNGIGFCDRRSGRPNEFFHLVPHWFAKGCYFIVASWSPENAGFGHTVDIRTVPQCSAHPYVGRDGLKPVPRVSAKAVTAPLRSGASWESARASEGNRSCAPCSGKDIHGRYRIGTHLKSTRVPRSVPMRVRVSRENVIRALAAGLPRRLVRHRHPRASRHLESRLQALNPPAADACRISAL